MPSATYPPLAIIQPIQLLRAGRVRLDWVPQDERGSKINLSELTNLRLWFAVDDPSTPGGVIISLATLSNAFFDDTANNYKSLYFDPVDVTTNNLTTDGGAYELWCDDATTGTIHYQIAKGAFSLPGFLTTTP